ncbi:hypothetical protein D3C75_1135230 [compost metagenome]
MLGRILRRTGEIDNQAWLFVLAEPTLRKFSQRIADDLPEDLAVLCAVDAPAENVWGIADDKITPVPIEPSDQHISGFTSVDTGSAFSSSEMVSMKTYRISFSKDYRQQMLAIF